MLGRRDDEKKRQSADDDEDGEMRDWDYCAVRRLFAVPVSLTFPNATIDKTSPQTSKR